MLVADGKNLVHRKISVENERKDADCKHEVAERGETPWTWEQMQKWNVDCKAKRIQRNARSTHQKLSEWLQKNEEREEKKLAEIKAGEEESAKKISER
uniref:Uncharacterized protein n=1 Tax=Cucumis melo TaxID=3656 RepID=A0A9I9CVE3_CUCME